MALEKNTDHTAAASSRSRSVGARPMNKTAIAAAAPQASSV
jgi:hypothetical protein